MTRVVVSVDKLGVRFKRGHANAELWALREVSLEIVEGETVGVVGESGAGKTTLGRVLLGLVRPSSGTVTVAGVPIEGRRSIRRNLRGRLQVVPQNPDWSLNPHLQVWRSIAEPLAILRTTGARERRAKVDEVLEQVGLQATLATRRPHELSGGQRQRVAIARAIITTPDLIVFDEAVTALDASVQAQVLNLIRNLQAERRFAALFISHDLAAVRYVSHRIAVALNGELVEIGSAEQFYGTPQHPYSRELLASAALALPESPQSSLAET